MVYYSLNKIKRVIDAQYKTVITIILLTYLLNDLGLEAHLVPWSWLQRSTALALNMVASNPCLALISCIIFVG